MICLRERLRVLTGRIRVLGNEKVVMKYGTALHGGALEERFLFLDSMCSELSPYFPLLQGHRIKKAIRTYIHTHTERKEQSFLQLSMSCVIILFPSPFPAHPWVNYIGSKRWSRCALGSALPDGKGAEEILLLFWVDLKRNSSSLFPPSTEKEIKSMQKSLRGRKGAQVPAFLQQELIIAGKTRSLNPGPDGCSSLKQEETLTSE